MHRPPPFLLSSNLKQDREPLPARSRLSRVAGRSIRVQALSPRIVPGVPRLLEEINSLHHHPVWHRQVAWGGIRPQDPHRQAARHSFQTDVKRDKKELGLEGIE
jgi:hypothetical protein